MRFDEYRAHDAVGLAELVAKSEVTATELLELALARLAAVNPALNAVVTSMEAIARTRAKGPLTGPFAGVPFLIKDLAQDYAGLPTGSGTRALADVPAKQNSIVVDRWLGAGLVVFGKTNTPEFGLKGITEPEVNGPTRNPWRTGHTPGGSSGGSAAAVAAGIVPAAGANDGGGSIRIPAACCGLFGLKPGRGLVPAGPAHAEMLHGAATDGVLSRSVRDTAAMLDVIAGADPAGPYLPAMPALSFTEMARRPPGRLRIGFTSRSPIGTDVSADAVLAVNDAAALLGSLGHDVEPAEPDIDGRQLAIDFLAMWFSAIASLVDQIHAGLGKKVRFELDTEVMIAVGRTLGAADYVSALERWNVHSRRLAEFHARYDLLLTPTLAGPPARIGEFATPTALQHGARAMLLVRGGSLMARTGFVEKVADANLKWVPYTQLANVTGRPAMSVPLYWTSAGLPLGVQLVGPLGGEGMMLSLATQLEAARPWMLRYPPLENRAA